MKMALQRSLFGENHDVNGSLTVYIVFLKGMDY